jgi:hypothetical protein
VVAENAIEDLAFIDQFWLFSDQGWTGLKQVQATLEF